MTNFKTSDRLRAVADAIEAHPQKFAMETYFYKPGIHSNYEQLTELLDGQLNECGTSACIAGWAIHLFNDGHVTEHALDWLGNKYGDPSEFDAGAALLGLNEDEADSLFYNMLLDAETAPAYLRALANDLAEDGR